MLGLDTSSAVIDALPIGESRPPDASVSRLDVVLIFAGVLFVFVGVVIIAQFLCRSDTKKVPEEGGAMSEAERKAFEVKLRREVMEEMEAEEKANPSLLLSKRSDSFDGFAKSSRNKCLVPMTDAAKSSLDKNLVPMTDAAKSSRSKNLVPMTDAAKSSRDKYLVPMTPAKRIDDTGKKLPSTTGNAQSTRAAPLTQETSRSTRDRPFSTKETARSSRDAPGGPWTRESAQSMRDAPCSSRIDRTREGPTSVRAPNAQSMRAPWTRESAQSMRDAPCSPRIDRTREGPTSVRAPNVQSIRANETSRSTRDRILSTETTRSMRDAPSMRCAPLTLPYSKRAPMSAIRESRVLTERNF